MIYEWLEEAVHLYNTVSYHWPECKGKHYSEQQLPAIRNTAIHWLHDVTNRAGISSSLQRPSTNWISDWHTPPVFEQRQKWETYFCNVILRAKNVAKVLHKSVRLTSEHPGTNESTNEEQKSKKARTTGPEEQADVNPLELLNRRLSMIEKRITQLEQSSTSRHYESMREMDAQYRQVRIYLNSFHRQQSHLVNLIDRVQK